MVKDKSFAKRKKGKNNEGMDNYNYNNYNYCNTEIYGHKDV